MNPSITPLVCDYMNDDLVYLREGDHLRVALAPMLDLGISAVPVLDAEHRPISLVTMRDFAEERTSPRDAPTLIAASATIAEAARVMTQANVHHLVVVDASGSALGMLASLDVIRGLAGLPPRHPPATKRFRTAQSMHR